MSNSAGLTCVAGVLLSASLGLLVFGNDAYCPITLCLNQGCR